MTTTFIHDYKVLPLPNVEICLNESVKLRALHPLAPTHLTHHRCAPYTPARVRTLPSVIRALRVFFVFCCVVSFLRYCLRLKNPRKAKGPDFIALKVIKFASDCYLSSPLKHYNKRPRKKNNYSEKPKTALVRPIFKKNERNKIGNYRPLSILNGMSKIYERCIHNSFSSYAETILSNFISAYKKSYSPNHVLLNLIENCENSRDNKNFLGIVLLDLSKAFGCIPHEFLASKLPEYGLSIDAVTLAHSYYHTKT